MAAMKSLQRCVWEPLKGLLYLRRWGQPISTARGDKYGDVDGVQPCLCFVRIRIQGHLQVGAQIQLEDVIGQAL